MAYDLALFEQYRNHPVVDVAKAWERRNLLTPSSVRDPLRTAEGRYDAAAHLALVHRVAGLTEKATADSARARQCVVVLDNSSVHHAAAVKNDARVGRGRRDVLLSASLQP